MILMVRHSKNYRIARHFAVLVLLTSLAILVAGYHPGAEDDGVYLSAINKDLNPGLYPHDSDFFTLQLQATVFDKLIAGSVRLTHLSIPVVVLAWHFLTILLILWGCWQISKSCFSEWYAQWCGVSLVAVLLTLPVAGTALYLVDQNLHPRAMATAAILGAIVACLDRRLWLAITLLTVAVVLHPLMASFGFSYCVFLLWGNSNPGASAVVASILPLGWVFEPTSEAWREAAHSRSYYFLSNWQWYEWLGVFAPLALLWWFYRLKRKDAPVLARVVLRLLWFSVFQFAVALAIVLPPSLDRLKPFQPMRYLHLMYLLFVLLAGGLIGQRILRSRPLRWVLLFAPLAAVMFFVQRQTFPATAHLELPGVASSNPWLEAFAWIQQKTPQDSMFAVDPYYMERPGEDAHSFRALAERSVLADWGKDPSVATQVPHLALRWEQQVQAQAGWEHFQMADFQRLHAQFGVDWVVLQQPGVAGMQCPYQNAALLVCRISGEPPPPESQ
jgi:hypothetical protein